MSDDERLFQLVRENVRRIAPYKAGKPIEELERELGIARGLKLASNENCLGPSPRALAAARVAVESGLHVYPDPAQHRLRRALSERAGVAPDQVFVGCGTTEIVQLLCYILLDGSRSAVFAAGGFVLYRIATMAAGGEGRPVPLDGDERHDLEAMARAIEPSTRLVFIANPNNPTGTWVGRDRLERFLAALPGHVLVVIDEAYREYVEEEDYPDGADWLRRGLPVLVLRTFSKAHGLAGMRIGYGLGPAALVDALDRVRSPFNVTTLGQAMALAALDDDDHVRRSRQHNRTERAVLEAELDRRGVRYTRSVANFVLLETGELADGPFQALLRQGVITRPMAAYGFPTRLRVSVGTHEANLRFLEAWDRARS